MNWIASLDVFDQFVDIFAFTDGDALVKLSRDDLVQMGIPPAAVPLSIKIAELPQGMIWFTHITHCTNSSLLLTDTP